MAVVEQEVDSVLLGLNWIVGRARSDNRQVRDAYLEPAWRARYVAQFETVILLNVLDRLNAYRDSDSTSHVVVARGVPVDDGYQVATTVQSGNDPPVRVTWRVSYERGEPRIVDVAAEGISLRVTLRSDFSSYLRQHDNNLDSLFEAMHRITDVPPGSTPRAPSK